MNSPTAAPSTFNLTIAGREFVAQGPTPRFGTYLLTGPRGATYLAIPFQSDPTMLFVVGGRYSATELRIRGNRVLLSTASGELRDVTR